MNLIYIIGPARTGTSALTTLVRNMGAASLPSNVLGKYNPNYQENVVVNALSEAIHPWWNWFGGDDNVHYREAIGMYIVENVKLRGEPGCLVIKCPCFPFMIPHLKKIPQIISNLGIPTDPYYVVSHRDRDAMVGSASKFTGDVFGDGHWGRVYDAAYRRIDEGLGDEWIRVEYEDLVEDWEREAKRLAKFIPGLKVPADGGINPDLNHEELRDAS